MESQSFSPMLDRVMAQEIQSVSWSKTMDVCAILYVNNQLEICRVSEQLQRMFMIQEDDAISNIIVESTFLTYNVGNKLFLYHLASHQKIIQSTLIKSTDKIKQMLLVQVNVKIIKELELQAAIIPLSTTNLKNWQNLCFLKQQQINNIIFSLTNRQIAYNFNGILHLGEIEHKGINELYQLQNELHCFSDSTVEIYDISLMKHQQILKYIQQLSYLNELFCFLKTSILLINTQLQDIFKCYQLNIIGPLISFGPQESINFHILKFYQKGDCPQELVQFFQKELYNTKILQKMDDNITNSFNNIQEIIQDSLMNVLSRILIILNFFIQSKNMPFYQGLHKTPFEELQQTVQKIQKLFSRFQIECHQTKLHLRNFFVWLNLCAIKAGNEQEVECENVNSPLNKIEVDLSKLFDFLKDNHLFQLRNLQCFYQGKISPRTFFTKVVVQKNVEFKQTENITKILQNVFKDSYMDNVKQQQNQIEYEESFETVNSLIRELQNNLDKIAINLKPQLKNKINIDLSSSILRFSEKSEDSYLISVLKDNTIIQYTYQQQGFAKSKKIQFNNKFIKELQYFDGKLIILSTNQQQSSDLARTKQQKEEGLFNQLQLKAYISSGDLEIQNKFECHSIKDLQVSKKGLISIIIDSKKLIILSI
ncbi:unnamed protein product [Paramecium octaurelia]|uniref:Anaphase-promoting complex subunit 4 long domain-containing protein n=1 Tax=Paramecium octaurelia TaxID=43137 RepID=A0A8S1VVH7_PAROT|nr:unnamed protein product [Paramecium octaurelia]